MSQFTPGVTVSEAKHRDWIPWIVALLLVAFLVLLAIAIANPHWLQTEPVARAAYYEPSGAAPDERYIAQPAPEMNQAIRAERFSAMHASSGAALFSEQFLKANPEVALFWRWQEQR